MNEALSVKKLCKRYPSFYLNNVCFSFESGSIMGFIGRNGAGKTTTLKCLFNLVHPDSGEIVFFDMPLIGNENKIKQLIGFASGAVNYYPQKRIGDIAAVTKTFYEAFDEDAYKKYLSVFKLDESKKVKELSEGMKVKFNLALALSHGAKLLILDEPTSGLDPVSRDELLTIFGKLADKGVSILFSTHITTDLEKCADSITYIKNGVITASCRKDEFISSYGGDSLENIMVRLEKEDIAL